MEFCLITKTLLIGKEGTGLLRKSESKRDIPGANGADEAHGPPAESECLQWNSTVNFQTLKKTVDQLDGEFAYSMK